jgi:hypothetical protein
VRCPVEMACTRASLVKPEMMETQIIWMAEMQLAKLKMDGAEVEPQELPQLAILSVVIIIESLGKLETTETAQIIKDAKLTAVENFQVGTDRVGQHHQKILV